MKIVHLCLYGPLMDAWNYQDNMLTKFQAKAGHDVTIITSKWVWNKHNKLEKYDKTNYFNADGVKIIRLEIKNGKDILYKFKRYVGLIDEIEKENPNILFIHNAAYLDINKVVGYLKVHPNVRSYVDNHNDFSNSATNWVSKNILHKGLWRLMYKRLEPYTTKFYGVLPARVDFLTEVYRTPVKKTELLVMGADDEQVERVRSQDTKDKVRKLNNIRGNDFLIVTGGKIDAYKTQVLLLMQAVEKFDNRNIKLIVFGSISDELRENVMALCDGSKIIYSGWLNTSESYDYFSAADLVVFPGRHSVFWEQVAGMGIPMICKYWDGTTHVDTNGNVLFLHNDSVDEIYDTIRNLIDDRTKFEKIKKKAYEAKSGFLYSKIARKSIES